MRGEVYRLPARGKGHEQKGRRYAVVLQPDWLTLSTWIVAFTSTSARPTSFRPPVAIGDQQTLVMCDQLATVDLTRLTEPIGFLTIDEMQRVDNALAVVLDLVANRHVASRPNTPGCVDQCSADRSVTKTAASRLSGRAGVTPDLMRRRGHPR